MSEITKLMLKDVRCFAGQQEFDIRPLTFLVGENSTGKSTALGCFQVLNNFLSERVGEIDFNIKPYQMGSFSDIARKTNSYAKEFELGFQMRDMEYRLNLIARKDGSEPIIKSLAMVFPKGSITIEKRYKNPKSSDGEGRLESDRKNRFRGVDVKENKDNIFTLSVNEHFFYWFMNSRDLYHFMEMSKEEIKGNASPEFKKCMVFLSKYTNDIRHYRTDTKTDSFAPIRSQPERTYNPLKETADPEGSEMPVALMNLSTSNKREWKDLKTKLEEFGKSSGLFTDIDVRKLGRSMSDPFQLQIKVRGPKGNIVDVGYGISQILPILVRVLLTRKGRFLLQQPEVHLHPKGQAELTSLLIAMTKENKSFVVETHSDAMINRARIDIMQGKIAPEDVSLIFLEPKGNKVEVHNIKFDQQANMIGVPDSYGDFFLDESNKLLGFGD